MSALSRLAAVMRKETLQMRRDRLTFAMIIGIPLLQILLFGYAINTDVRNITTAVADEANSHLSREFIARLEQTQVTRIDQRVNTARDLENLLRAGKISIGIAIPPDFDRRIVDPERAAAHILVDGSDPTIGGIADALRNMPLSFDTGREKQRLEQIEIRAYFNPERRTPVNVIPGLIGVILTMTMMIFTAVAIVRERELGNLELLINTPVSSAELMLGKVVPYIVIGLIQLLVILLAGDLLFNVPVRGSVLDLYLAASLFIAANLALGLFVSTAVKSQFQAMQMTFFLILPSILLSGFVFPFDGMPKFAQYLGEALPITHFIRLTRGIMLREASLGDMPGAMLYLAAFSVVAITAAALRFSKRLD
ncbi:MAG: ABC transporter permease [Gammaproteobacteria bacterium]|nr:ABC transporter permease [Gammaproteobacteria bacterium]MDH5302682.1 ABC transporter permease [Gammaproteobacteria bacterium]MDH5320881.1 ABC transporter permease [Gammaproteobacteria bacterium]